MSRRLVSSWYRSVDPDGKVWCETSDLAECLRMSEGREVKYLRMRVFQVEEPWEPFEPHEQTQGDDTRSRRMKALAWIIEQEPRMVKTAEVAQAVHITKPKAQRDLDWLLNNAYVERKTDWSRGSYIYRSTEIGRFMLKRS